MRIAIHTLGTRGDVQPYLALALGLMKRGHAVQLAAPAQFQGMASALGVPFSPLPGEFLALLDTPEGKAAVAGGKGFSAGFKLLKTVRPLMRRLLDEEWHAASAFAPDVIVYHPKSIAAAHMAEKIGCPCILASPLPGFTPTSAFPTPLLPFRSLGPFNRASHVLAIKGAGLLFGKLIMDWRATTLGLSRRRESSVAPSGTLYAYSRHVVPIPSDWGDDVLVSGYWFLDSEDWTPSASLKAFLDAGEPPVYAGFGSMPGIDPQHMASMIIDALARCGKRGLLASGGGALEADRLPPHVHLIDHAPHDALLPLVAATIHHGGAGTVAASLRAGKPMTICPFLGDQPFWARRMNELGVAPPPLDRKTMTADSIAFAIKAMSDADMRARANALGERVRQEDGVGMAVRFLEARCGPR
ncbi:glycosyltransferase [Hyphomicrobium sp.]|uniref:glycosyltransferase n=1 Tax=Hyphomicrobium sp. TaxID=82 RepID=UPI0025C43C73|nr:glycosyltransferase [Hyphomicrobium sp.]MCC7250437.1 glycosyltransferase family 1 protein [Hyphomicrobium sp.]